MEVVQHFDVMGAMGLYASPGASVTQMSATSPSRGPPLLFTESVVGDRVRANICKCPLGEESEDG